MVRENGEGGSGFARTLAADLGVTGLTVDLGVTGLTVDLGVTGLTVDLGVVCLDRRGDGDTTFAAEDGAKGVNGMLTFKCVSRLPQRGGFMTHR